MQPVNSRIEHGQELIAAAEAARILGVSGEWVRQLTAAGKLPALTVQPNGYRAYFRADVERLKAQREAVAEGN